MEYINLTTEERLQLGDLCAIKNASIPVGVDYEEILVAENGDVSSQIWSPIRDVVPILSANQHLQLTGIEKRDDGHWYYRYNVVDNQNQTETVPTEVSRFQAQAAIYNAGHWDAVDGYFQQPTTPFLEKIAWNTAQVFYRDSDLVNRMAAMLGMDDQALDSLFIMASKIKA